MLISSRFKTEDVDLEFKDFVNSQSYGLSKIIQKIDHVKWNFERRGKEYTASCSISSPSMRLFSKKSAYSLLEAFSLALDAIEVQAKKFHKVHYKDELNFKKTA